MEKFAKIAKEAAHQAGQLLKSKIKNRRQVREKHGAVDIVTDADLKAQELIVNIITKHFPHHGILAEESEKKIDVNAYHYIWAVDPIDGTSAYAAGLPAYSCSIALLYHQQPIVAAVYVALTDEIVWAIKGKGAYSSNHKLSVSSLGNLPESTIGFDPSYVNREYYIKTIAAPLADQVRILPMTWSQAASLALVGKGILDGFIQCNNPKVWDVAAGKVVVEEAHGMVTDFTGQPVDLFAIDGYVAGNKAIHKKLLIYTNQIVV